MSPQCVLSVILKMERVLVVSVLVATLAAQRSYVTTVDDDINYVMASESSGDLEIASEESHDDDLRDELTFGEVFQETFGEEILEWRIRGDRMSWEYIKLIVWLLKLNADISEIYDNFAFMHYLTLSELSSYLRDVPIKVIYNVLNENCSQYQETRIQDLSDTECVKTTLVKWLTPKLKDAITFTEKKMSDMCRAYQSRICLSEKQNCILTFQERAASLIRNFTIEINDVKPLTAVRPLHIIKEYLVLSLEVWDPFFSSPFSFLQFITHSLISTPSILERVSEHFRPPMINQVLPTSILHTDDLFMSYNKFTWGVVRSNTGTFKLPCSAYRDSRNSSHFLDYLKTCSSLSLVRLMTDFARCADSKTAYRLMTWPTTPSLYFHSQCLCVAFNGLECGVKVTSGRDSRHYCLSVLLRDFQRQVSHRPAVTYLDYALQTRVSVCKFTTLLAVSFSYICNDTAENKTYLDIFSAKCLFEGLVDAELNCPRTLSVAALNLTELCLAKFFTQLIMCDDDVDDEVRVPYYAAGDSPLVHVLTCVDVVARVLTLITYLTCSQLRNLPGKLFIAYLTTALLRLVLVRVTNEDLPLAVRFDVVLDLSCTLCLTAYNRFLTSSFKALRPLDSLTRDDVRQVLMRYALLGWALPLVLSAAFFSVDVVLDSPVQIGQLLFVLTDYAALLYNLYLFHGVYKCYHDYRTDTEFLRRDARARGVYADLFVFALKTSVLSGAGIIFRLVFTQIQGLEHVLGYYHALGTLQGLLLFLLYGCNREARVFWLGVGSSTLRRCQRWHDSSSRRRDVMEMVPIRHRGRR